MTILVTGGTGFLGNHVVRLLRGSQTEDVIAVSLDSCHAPGVVCCDLSDAAATTNLLEKFAPTQIYHLAASMSGDFETDLRNNVFAARHILDCCGRSLRGTRILLVGSAAEYGLVEAWENPISEKRCLRPVSTYGWTKAAQTNLASYYCVAEGLGVVVARIFNLFGRGMSEQLFVGRVERQIQAVLAGEISRIFVGGLDAKRDYVDLTVASRALLTIMNQGSSGEVYNVGSGTPVVMRDLLGRMLFDAGLDFGVVEEEPYRKPGAEREVREIYADITKLSLLVRN